MNRVPHVRLIKKLAPMLNGLDVSSIQVGDVIPVPGDFAAMLVREGWAELVETPQERKFGEVIDELREDKKIRGEE
jgi:hypothetical protein